MLASVLKQLVKQVFPEKFYRYDIFPVATGTDLDGSDYHGIHRFSFKYDNKILFETSFNVYDYVSDVSKIIPDDLYYDESLKYREDSECSPESAFYVQIVYDCLGTGLKLLDKSVKADNIRLEFGTRPHVEKMFKLVEIKKLRDKLYTISEQLKYVKKSDELQAQIQSLIKAHNKLIYSLSEQAKNYVIKERELKRALRKQ